MNGASPGAPVLIVRGITGQAASVQEWRDGNNDLLGHITPDGAFFREMGLATKLGGSVVSQFFQIDGKNKFAFSAFDTALNVSRYDDAGNFKDTGFQILRDGGTFVNTPFTVRNLTPVTGTTTLTVKAGEGQGTTKLQEWQNNGGTVLSSVDEIGNLEMNGRYIDFDQMTAPLPPATNRVRLFVDAASGELSVKKDTGVISGTRRRRPADFAGTRRAGKHFCFVPRRRDADRRDQRRQRHVHPCDRTKSSRQS